MSKMMLGTAAILFLLSTSVSAQNIPVLLPPGDDDATMAGRPESFIAGMTGRYEIMSASELRTQINEITDAIGSALVGVSSSFSEYELSQVEVSLTGTSEGGLALVLFTGRVSTEGTIKLVFRLRN